MKKLSLLAACFLLVFLLCTVSLCAAEPEIKPFETVKIFVSGNNCTILKFTPAESGKYCFESVCDYDTAGFVFDENMAVLAHDETSGEGANFKITFFFENGKTYYLGAKHALGMTLDFEVRLTEASHEHSFELLSKTEPTCKAPGIFLYSCRCGAQKIQNVAALAHSFRLIATNATCTKGGNGIFECINCGFIKTQPQQALSHEGESSFKTEKAATCTADGKESLFCRRCAKVLESRKIPKLSHDFSNNFETIKEPTCTKAGIKTKRCKRCLAEGEKITVPAKGHSFEKSFSLDKKATLFESGTKSRHCRRCTAVSEKRTISKIGTVKLLQNEFLFSEKNKKPSLIIKDSKGNTLKAERDYKASFDKNAKSIGTYSVKITFLGNYDGKKTLSFKIIPQTASYLAAKQNTNSITLSWNDCGGGVKYKIYKYIKASDEYIALGTASKPVFKASKLKSGTDYVFAVQTFKEVSGKTYFSRKMKDLKTATVPAQTSIKAAKKDGGAALSWKPVSCTGYIIYMSGEKNEQFKQIKNVRGGSERAYRKTNLSQSKTYYFKIQPYKTVGGKTLYGKMSKAVKLQ